jgi:hypothetical protein
MRRRASGSTAASKPPSAWLHAGVGYWPPGLDLLGAEQDFAALTVRGVCRQAGLAALLRKLHR